MKLSRWVTNNFWWKVGALAMATLIYFLVRDYSNQMGLGGITESGAIGNTLMWPIPIQVMSRPGDGLKYEVEPPKAFVQFYGPAKLLRGLTESDFRVYVEVPKGGLGRRSALLVRAHAPLGVEVIQIRPVAASIEPSGGRPGATEPESLLGTP